MMMASLSTLTNRVLVAGAFAAVGAAAPVVVALATPATPSGPALADCPSNEIMDPNSGACKPIDDVTPQGQVWAPTNPIEPGVTNLAPGAITESGQGNVGQLPEVNGVPCNGGNTGLCIGLEENNPSNTGGVTLPPVPVGAHG